MAAIPTLDGSRPSGSRRFRARCRGFRRSRRAARSPRAAREAFERCAERPPLMAVGDRARPAGSMTGRPPPRTSGLERRRSRSSRCAASRRVFDVSAPLLSRLIAREPRRTLTAVDGLDFAIRPRRNLRARRRVRLGQIDAGAHGGRARSSRARDRSLIEGVDLARTGDRAARRAVRRRMQMIFQDPFASLNPRWRVGDIIAEPIRAFGARDAGAGGRASARSRSRVGELLELVGLHPADARKFPHEFSGGQRQRIAIARAIAAHPDFIVCDEPTSALDVSIQAQILNLMRDLQERLGLTYLLITHNLAVVRFMATRVGVMYLGRLVEIGETDALFATAAPSLYTRMLLDAVPDLSMSGRPRTPVRRRAAQPDRSPARLPVPSALPAGDRDLQNRAARLPRQCRLPSRAWRMKDAGRARNRASRPASPAKPEGCGKA